MDKFERDRLHRSINYKLCTSLDMLKFGIVLDQMVSDGVLHHTVARTFNLQASALLASVRQANDQHFGKTPSSPIV